MYMYVGENPWLDPTFFRCCVSCDGRSGRYRIRPQASIREYSLSQDFFLVDFSLTITYQHTVLVIMQVKPVLGKFLPCGKTFCYRWITPDDEDILEDFAFFYPHVTAVR